MIIYGKHFIAFTILFSGLICRSCAQQADTILRGEAINLSKNAVYIEFIGNAPSISLNYERRLFRKDKISFYVRTGLGLDVINFEKGNVYIPSVPLETSVAFGKYKHFIELGLGLTPFLSKFPVWSEYVYDHDTDIDSIEYELYLTGVARIGYRFESKRHWLWRIAYTPILYNSSNDYDNYSTNFGLSIGKLF